MITSPHTEFRTPPLIFFRCVSDLWGGPSAAWWSWKACGMCQLLVFWKLLWASFLKPLAGIGKWETVSTNGDDFTFCTWGVGCLWRDAKHPRSIVRDDRRGSKKESSHHRSFVFQIVIGIKIQILIGVSRLSVNGDLRWTTLTMSMQVSRKGSFPFPFPRWTECAEVHGV